MSKEKINDLSDSYYNIQPTEQPIKQPWYNKHNTGEAIPTF